MTNKYVAQEIHDVVRRSIDGGVSVSDFLSEVYDAWSYHLLEKREYDLEKLNKALEKL